ncbi:MAG: YicC/YloC family endoribonuclease [Acidobacteriota bacterium]
MRSMTGFGQQSFSNDRFEVTFKLRGVNHRFLELRLHLPDELRPMEGELRELLTGELFRGRVDANVDLRPVKRGEARLLLDEKVIAATHEAVGRLRERGWVSAPLTFTDLLAVPQAVTTEVAEVEWRDEDGEILRRAAAGALEQMREGRQSEGDKLRAVLSQRIEALSALAKAMTAARETVRDELAENLRTRLADILKQVPVDEDRMLQEVAVLVDRSDIAEELDRLTSHLDHFLEVMAKAGSVGKRLDFLTQEIFRELNTLGAKCRDAAMTRQVLDGKVLCEQLREQVQNVE